MRIVAVDDEVLALDSILACLRSVAPGAEAVGFGDAEEGLGYLEDHGADVALLDVEMGGLTGLELARRCRELHPRINIIFTTGYSQYALDALKLHASGYLMKPIREEDLRAELENLRHPPKKPSCARVHVQAFGSFEIFVDNRPLKLPLSKCKECLAYLVDRKGALVSYAELAVVLWEDRPYNRTMQNNVNQVVFKMMKALEEAGIQDIVIRSHGTIAINREHVDCDYFNALDSNEPPRSFTGEYMSNYSWAESTLGAISAKWGRSDIASTLRRA